jgi:feruloyl-CoA synthase
MGPVDVGFATPAVELIRSAGGLVLRSRHQLKPYARCTGDFLERWAALAPGRDFLVQRSADGTWRALSYGQALVQVRRIAAWLLEQKLSEQRPVAILSQNSLEHGVLSLACLHVGIPVAPISPAYSLVSRDFCKLKSIVGTLNPGVVYVGEAQRFAEALRATRDLHQGTVVAGDNDGLPQGVVSFATLTGANNDAAVARAFAAITPDTIAKLMFTSGSTGEPKAVITTQRMLCSNQQAIAQVWRFLDQPPVLVDWLPWHHTFGGNHNFNLVLRNGGTLYIDDGRPLPGQFETTLANLRDVAPTLCLNVPRALNMLVDALSNEAALRERFFSRLQVLFYAGAALSQPVWGALRALGEQTVGRPPTLLSSWGLTETAPAATTCHFQPQSAGVIGLPIPGCELKLVANGQKLEVRVRGPNVTPGYWKRPDLTARLFDQDGFIETGDAMHLVDPDHPEQGLFFDGRVAEDFKLSSATWVSVGTLRLAALAALAPVAEDVVVTGHDRDEIGLLIFPNLSACRKLSALPSDAEPASVLQHPSVRASVATGLATLNGSSQGSSTTAARALLLQEPPSLDAGEITDKGYVNQRTVLARRAAWVDLLYAAASAEVITPLGAKHVRND